MMKTMKPTATTPKQHRVRGFSLVEVALALGVCSFCLVALLGLIPAGLTSSQNSISQTGAISILRSVASDLKSARPDALTTPEYGISLPNTTQTALFVEEGGRFGSSLTSVPRARYRVSISTVSPAGNAPQSTLQRILVTWPAGAQPQDAAGSLETLVALDRKP